MMLVVFVAMTIDTWCPTSLTWSIDGLKMLLKVENAKWESHSDNEGSALVSFGGGRSYFIINKKHAMKFAWYKLWW